MEIDGKTLYWLIGYLEGEGSFMKGSPSNPNQPIIVVSSTDEDVIQDVAQLFERRYQKVSSECRAERGWKPAFVVRLRGTKAVELMRKLLPLMGEIRKVQIQKALDSYNPDIKKKLSDQQVLEILSTKRGRVLSRLMSPLFFLTGIIASGYCRTSLITIRFTKC